jgi:hypothetical protein
MPLLRARHAGSMRQVAVLLLVLRPVRLSMVVMRLLLPLMLLQLLLLAHWLRRRGPHDNAPWHTRPRSRCGMATAAAAAAAAAAAKAPTPTAASPHGVPAAIRLPDMGRRCPGRRRHRARLVSNRVTSRRCALWQRHRLLELQRPAMPVVHRLVGRAWSWAMQRAKAAGIAAGPAASDAASHQGRQAAALDAQHGRGLIANARQAR